MDRQKHAYKGVPGMRELGVRIYQAVRGKEDFGLPVKVIRAGEETTKSPNFKYLKPEEIQYTAENRFTGAKVTETWMRVMRGHGVTVLPLIRFGGADLPVLIFKPQPAVESWSIELVSGAKGPDTIEQAVKRELRQEAGLETGSVTIMKSMENAWHAPHRLNTTDTMAIAERLTFVGKQNDEKEEGPISPFIATWPEVVYYLRNNAIKYNSSIAMLGMYLLFHAPGLVSGINEKEG